MKMNKLNIKIISNEDSDYNYNSNIDYSNFIWKFNSSFIKEGEKWGTSDGSPVSDITNSRVISNVLYGVMLDKILK